MTQVINNYTPNKIDQDNQYLNRFKEKFRLN